MRFQDKIYQLRKNKNLSQEQVAEQFSVSRQTVGKWETGKAFPEIDKLLSLARFYGVSVDTLLDESECNDYSAGAVGTGSIIASQEQLAAFLLLAKRNTYAGKGKEEAESCRLESHDYCFRKAPFVYHDSFFGTNIFTGQELVYENNIPVWSMNYLGRVVEKGFSADFLKEALFVGDEKNPYRGPLLYSNGEYTYHNLVKGTFEWYEGFEEIFYGGNKVYECRYHGGMLI